MLKPKVGDMVRMKPIEVVEVNDGACEGWWVKCFGGHWFEYRRSKRFCPVRSPLATRRQSATGRKFTT
jgi:hypothetical protein